MWGPDNDFWLELADRLGARTIIDLGCGTGLLTRALAVGERLVIGVDPSPAMLAVAQKAPGAEKVRWIQGDASVLGAIGADLALMTGNVAQVFLEDEAWESALRASPAGEFVHRDDRTPGRRGIGTARCRLRLRPAQLQVKPSEPGVKLLDSPAYHAFSAL